MIAGKVFDLFFHLQLFQVLLPAEAWLRLRKRLQANGSDYAAVRMRDGRYRVLCAAEPRGTLSARVSVVTARKILETIAAEPSLELSSRWRFTSAR